MRALQLGFFNPTRETSQKARETRLLGLGAWPVCFLCSGPAHRRHGSRLERCAALSRATQKRTTKTTTCRSDTLERDDPLRWERGQVLKCGTTRDSWRLQGASPQTQYLYVCLVLEVSKYSKVVKRGIDSWMRWRKGQMSQAEAKARCR